MGKAVLRGLKDCHVYREYPDRFFNQHSYLVTRDYLAPKAALSYVAMLRRPYPRGATLVSAKLVMFSVDAYTGGTATIEAQRLEERRDFDRLTWADQPTLLTGSVPSTQTNPPAGHRWEWDITAHAQELSDGSPNYGWRIRSYVDSRIRFYSADTFDPATRPFMEFEWEDKPSPPSQLSPSADRAVGVPAPTFRFDFTDVSGDTSLQAVRVQINDIPFDVGVDWDSGEVTAFVPELDSAAAGYGGAGVDSTEYWRVTVRDGAGLWSDWSEWAAFRYVPREVLTITSPTDGAKVEDVRPIIRWTMTDQTAFRVTIYDLGGDRLLYSSRKQPSTTARSWPLPFGLMSFNNKAYVVRVRAWDTENREASSGMGVFSQDTNDFYFDRDGSLTPITNLEGTKKPDETGIVLRWDSAIEPEAFVIIRDGEVIELLEAPDDLINDFGPQQYRWVDYKSRPRSEHVWEVARVVNGVTGKDGPTITATLEPEGVYLVRPDTGQRVMLLNTPVSGWDIPEQSTLHTPLGAQAPVLITQGISGYRGTIEGEIWPQGHGANEVSAQAERDDFLAFKERVGVKCLLILHTHAMTVVVWNLVDSPIFAGSTAGYAVSFDFAQVSDFDFDPDI